MADNILKTIIQLKTEGAQKAKKDLDAIGASGKKAMKDTDAGARKLKNALLSVGLTALFGGMAINRFFGGMARSMINTFMLVGGQTSDFAISVARLQGAWEFLKFSIMDALQQAGLLDFIIQKVITLTHWISSLDENQKVFWGKFIIGAAIAGAALMTLGQIALLFINPALFVVLGVVMALFFIWTSNGNKAAKVMKTLAVVIGGVTLALLLMGVTISLPILLIIGLVIIIIWLFAKLVNRVGGVKNAFKALGIFALRILAFIGDVIWDSLINPLNLVIKLINGVITALHKLGFAKNISKIGEIEGLGLGNRVDRMRDEFLTKVDAEKQAKPESQTNTFNITQLPGESGDALATRIASLMEQGQAMMNGSTQQ